MFVLERQLRRPAGSIAVQCVPERIRHDAAAVHDVVKAVVHMPVHPPLSLPMHWAVQLPVALAEQVPTHLPLQVPVLFMTGDDPARLRAGLADAVLRKPFTQREFFDAVGRAMGTQ